MEYQLESPFYMGIEIGRTVLAAERGSAARFGSIGHRRTTRHRVRPGVKYQLLT